MAASMISLGTAFWLGGKGMVALICMLVYTAGFAVSWGPVTWVLLSEIFPNQIRGKAMAVAVAAQWIANYLVSWTFPVLDENPWLVEHFKHGFAYWIYGVMSILAALFMWGFVPRPRAVRWSRCRHCGMLVIKNLRRQNNGKPKTAPFIRSIVLGPCDGDSQTIAQLLRRK